MTDVTSLADLRKDYQKGELDQDSVAQDPVEQFRRWFDEATESKLLEPNAMTVATVSPDGQPSARIVLLKGYGPDGFRFYSNYASQKGAEITANSRVALLFYWGELERQVRIEGIAQRLDRETTLEYHRSRPRKSQISATASRQTRPVPDRAALDRIFEDAEARFEGQDVPLADDWGGYLVLPTRFEFWQGRRSRRHDRVVYDPDGDGWRTGRLAP